MNRDPMVVVLTAIDGVLLDRSTRSLAQAANAIDWLEQEEIPLVFCSHNTRAEIEAVQHVAGNIHPFISENGAALYVPIGYFADTPEDARRRDNYHLFEFGPPYSHVALTLHLLARQLNIDLVTFSESSIDDIVRTWSVPAECARLAKRREYDELFYMVRGHPYARTRLLRALDRAKLRCITGDCCQHVNGVLDQGAGIDRLRSMYESAYGCPVLTVGLGIGLCDLALLGEVDLPIIVRDEWSGATETLWREVPTARITSSTGVAGWSHAVMDVVRTIQNMRGPDVWARPA